MSGRDLEAAMHLVRLIDAATAGDEDVKQAMAGLTPTSTADEILAICPHLRDADDG